MRIEYRSAKPERGGVGTTAAPGGADDTTVNVCQVPDRSLAEPFRHRVVTGWLAQQLEIGCSTLARRSLGNALTGRRAPRKGKTMHIIWSLIVGLVVGAIAKLLMPGKDPGGFIVTALLGIAGAMVAGFIGRALGLYHEGDVGPGVIASIIGAMLLLGIYRLATGRRRRIV